MFQENNGLKNKQQKHPKVRIQQYLYNASEPRDVYSHELPPELEVEMVVNSNFMKRRIIRKARAMRNSYS